MRWCAAAISIISGIIVMLERPVKVGDHIVVSRVEGDVIEIGARDTSLMTAQGSRVIMPNQMFITGNVINWDMQGQHQHGGQHCV